MVQLNNKMKKILYFGLLFITVFTLFSCKKQDYFDKIDYTPNLIKDNNRTYYEIFVRSFADSNNDGIGDLRGLINKLDYLNDGNPATTTDLGIDGIWLMPINPSPTYHKYDVTDYLEIDSSYGTMEDFDELIRLCDERGIKVIMDLVVNHTSYNHPWFQACKKAHLDGDVNNKYYDYYNFSKTSQSGYSNTGMDGQWYYEAQFWDQMPDLNFNSSAVRDEIKAIVDFWLNKGVGGFRLDAAKYIYYGKTVENQTFWKWFTDYCKSVKEDVYTVAEVWSAQNEVEKYYGTGLTSCFNFSNSQASGTGYIAAAINESSIDSFIENTISWNNTLHSLDEKAIDANFLSNHDNNRSAGSIPVSNGNYVMAAALYMLIPGNPFIYYGEEIAMKGSGIDENKRLAMLWGTQTTLTNPPNANYSSEYQTNGTVASQEKDKNSILNKYKTLIKIRNANPEIARGTLQLEDHSVDGVTLYSITYNGSKIYVLFNLSSETITYDLSKYGEIEPRGYLSSLSEKAQYKDDNITLPNKSVFLFK